MRKCTRDVTPCANASGDKNLARHLKCAGVGPGVARGVGRGVAGVVLGGTGVWPGGVGRELPGFGGLGGSYSVPTGPPRRGKQTRIGEIR